MPISRRLRFEILRRDNYTCRYCGARTPDATLTIDHVVPTTLGGDDDPRNLVTACQPCNAGKSSIPADAALVEDVDATAMLFAQATDRAAAQRRREMGEIDTLVTDFDAAWWEYTYEYDGKRECFPRTPDWRDTIERLLTRGLDSSDLRRYIAVAMRSRARDPWTYFCGCCWREITTRQELARRMIEDGDV